MEQVRKASLALPGVTGTVRMGATVDVVARLEPGDLAIIDHPDLDRDRASALVETGVRVVLNVGAFVSGRSTHHGAEQLAEAGVLLVEHIGPDVWTQVADGQRIRVVDGVVHDAPGEEHVESDGEVLAKGHQLDLSEVLGRLAEVRVGMADRMDAAARATSDLLRAEQELLVHGRGLPELMTPMGGRPVVVVARVDHDDLRALRTFVREHAPVLVATGEAADELLAEGWVPDVVVVRDVVPAGEVLQVAGDVVVLCPPGGTPVATGVEGAHPVISAVEPQGLALLLAEDAGADLVVGVGLDARIEELLDQSRPGLASTFVTRFRLGPRLLDASAVGTLYAGRPRSLDLALVVLAALVALLAALAVTQVGQGWFESLGDTLQGLT